MKATMKTMLPSEKFRKESSRAEHVRSVKALVIFQSKTIATPAGAKYLFLKAYAGHIRSLTSGSSSGGTGTSISPALLGRIIVKLQRLQEIIVKSVD